MEEVFGGIFLNEEAGCGVSAAALIEGDKSILTHIIGGGRDGAKVIAGSAVEVYYRIAVGVSIDIECQHYGCSIRARVDMQLCLLAAHILCAQITAKKWYIEYSQMSSHLFFQNENKKLLWDLLVESGTFRGEYGHVLSVFNSTIERVGVQHRNVDSVLELNKIFLTQIRKELSLEAQMMAQKAEMEGMLNPPKPKEIDFTEKIDERSVDDILEKQMLARESELSHYFKSVTDKVDRRLQESKPTTGRLRVEGGPLDESVLSDTLVTFPSKRVGFASDQSELLRGILSELKTTNELLRELVECSKKVS